tara:strand:+ start:52 stop:1998 length:1947 start_codon:yes stop_codon:yes gene_type:complete
MTTSQTQYIVLPSTCGNSFVSELSGVLDNFFGKISGAVNSANDFTDEIRKTADVVSDIVKGMAGQITEFLNDKLIGFVQDGLAAVQSFFFALYPLNPLAALAQTKAFNNGALNPIQRLFNTFDCLVSTVAKAMFKTVEDMLINAVKKGFVNPVVCAVEDFVGAITNKITNVIDSIVGPLINPINNLFSLIGQGFDLKNRIVAGLGGNYLSVVGNVLKCVDGGKGRCPGTSKYDLLQGVKKPFSEEQQSSMFSKAIDKGTSAVKDLNDGLSDFENDIGTWGIFGSEEGDDRDPLECNTGNVFECGPPRVEIFGGNGEGAAGDIILGNFIENFVEEIQDVDGINQELGTNFEGPFDGRDVLKSASIIGVDITYPGEGYTEEPIVSFVDNCDRGYGAYGRAVIDKDPNSPKFGQLIDIIITSPGENYPSDEEQDSFVDKVIIDDGGSGYDPTDTIDGFDLTIEDGVIKKVNPNNAPYRTLPVLKVATKTGSGARLKPIMTKRPRVTLSQQSIDCILPKGEIVGYVNGKPYSGPFHVHPTTGAKMVGAAHTTAPHAIIYGTPQESLRTGGSVGTNIGSTRVNLRSIQELVQESESTETSQSTETTENVDLYSDPVETVQETNVDTSGGSGYSPPPSSPSPPSGGGGGYGGGY